MIELEFLRLTKKGENIKLVLLKKRFNNNKKEL